MKKDEEDNSNSVFSNDSIFFQDHNNINNTMQNFENSSPLINLSLHKSEDNK